MTKEIKSMKLITEQVLGWFVGLIFCLGLAYFAAISGANEYNPIFILPSVGVIYFFVLIFNHIKDYLSFNFSYFSYRPKKNKQSTRKGNFFGPAILTLTFGPVFSVGIFILLKPSSKIEEIGAIVLGLIVCFGISFLWLNKKT